MKPEKKINRRQFVGTTAAAAAAFTIVPRHVLGGLHYVAPSDKLNIAYIGIGTQGIRELLPLLTDPDVQVTSVCDPNKFTTNYVDWSLHGVRNSVRELLKDPDWGEHFDGIPGGRDIGKEIVEKCYAKKNGKDNYSGCASYSDFR